MSQEILFNLSECSPNVPNMSLNLLKCPQPPPNSPRVMGPPLQRRGRVEPNGMGSVASMKTKVD